MSMTCVLQHIVVCWVSAPHPAWAHQDMFITETLPSGPSIADAVDESPLHHLPIPSSMCSKTMPPWGRVTLIALPSSNPGDRDLVFPPKQYKWVGNDCSDNALYKLMAHRYCHHLPGWESKISFHRQSHLPNSQLWLDVGLRDAPQLASTRPTTSGVGGRCHCHA
jgi:hypothetical protein